VSSQPELPPLAQILAALDSGAVSLDELRALGLSVFSTPVNAADGFGDGPFDPSETDPTAFGGRPTLQGNGKILRVNGLDAQSCNECHGFVSQATRPPTLGIAGVGGIVTNAIILPRVIDVADSGDDRVVHQANHDPDMPMLHDGVADFSGRFANPPFLFGGGGVELLGKEMTADLQALLAAASAASVGVVTSLDTHGVSFGYVKTLASGQLDFSDVAGIGPVAIRSVDEVFIKPFGRKGDNFSMRDFDRGAMQFHFGMQPAEVVGDADADGDSVTNEVSVSEMSMLHVFDVTNIPPVDRIQSREATTGFETFQEIGCDGCHIPALRTRSRHLPLAHPEVPTDPSANVYLEIDLKRVGFKGAKKGGVEVPLFADLKRHDMGPGLAESLEGGGAENRMFTTARLWGVADTAPYLHDGRAMTLFEAIALHGGEAEAARDAFVALSEAEKEQVLAFLGSLRTPTAPNEELVPIVRFRLEEIIEAIGGGEQASGSQPGSHGGSRRR
jgi:hypothetical protein